MGGQFEALVREMLGAFDRLDEAKVTSMLAEDAQGVDELSRKWTRGRSPVYALRVPHGPRTPPVAGRVDPSGERELTRLTEIPGLLDVA